MSASAADGFATLLSAYARPRLGAHGYSKAGSTFHRRVEVGWGVVSFQRSRFGTDRLTRFTVNLGVTLDRLALARGDDPSRRPAEHRCNWRTRIGSVLPAAEDRWWDLTADTDLQRLADEVLPLVVDRGLPLIDERLTEDGFVAALAVRPRVGQVARFTDAEIATLLGSRG